MKLSKLLSEGQLEVIDDNDDPEVYIVTEGPLLPNAVYDFDLGIDGNGRLTLCPTVRKTS